MRKAVQFKTRGMYRDFSVSSFKPEYSYENKNLRLYATDEPNMYSLINERGNKIIDLDGTPKIEGVPIGYSVLNNTMVLFTCGRNKYKEITLEGSDQDIYDINVNDSDVPDIYVPEFNDFIYQIDYKGDNLFSNTLLFSGDLNFSTEYPIETLANYENEQNQKVYWTDAYNTIRVLNIKDKDINSWTPLSFNFIKQVALREEITVTKQYNNGYFNAGVIQYAFTYYNLYGSETNIVYTTPLQYISFQDRGASPETTVSNSFLIKIKNSDTNFDYIRIYSIYRGSIDAVPEVRRITDLRTSTDTIIYADNGTVGETIDPTTMLYIGGEPIVAGTLSQKDNTLFLGDITVERRNIQELIGDDIASEYGNKKPSAIKFTTDRKAWVPPAPLTVYPYKNQLGESSDKIKTFKYLEWYRFGLQAQYSTGKWSDPVWIDDVQNDVHIDTTFYDGSKVKLPTAYLSLSDTIINKLLGAGYRRVRPVIVYPTITDREVICQGVLCPTVYNVGDRIDNSPFAQSSWFFRPNAPFDYGRELDNSVQFVLSNISDEDIAKINVGDIWYLHNRSNNSSNAYVVVKIITSSTHDNNSIRIRNYNPYNPYPPHMDTSIQTSGKKEGGGNDTFQYYYRREESARNIYLDSTYWGSPPSLYSKAGIVQQTNIFSNDNTSSLYYPNDRIVTEIVQKGAGLEFRHNCPIPSNQNRNAEIQCITYPPSDPYFNNVADTTGDYEMYYSNNFYIDQSIVTLHSPDVEFNDEVKNLDMSNAKLRIVGMVPVTAFTSDIDIQTETPALNFKNSSDLPLGFYKEHVGVEHDFSTETSFRDSNFGWKSLASGVFWFDELSGRTNNNDIGNGHHFTTGFVVYPWHRNGSLNNCTIVGENETKPSMLKSKVMSNLRVSYKTVFIDKNQIWNAYDPDNDRNGISGAYLYDSDELSIIRIPAPKFSDLEDIVYSGNIDKVITMPNNYQSGEIKDYPIIISGHMLLYDEESTNYRYGTNSDLFSSLYSNIDYSDDNPTTEQGTATDPVRIQYKSSPHLVMALNYRSDGAQIILPTVYNATREADGTITDIHALNNRGDSTPSSRGLHYFWDTYKKGNGDVVQNTLLYPNTTPEGINQGPIESIASIQHGWLWLGELYKDVSEDSRFGGKSNENLENNQWLPCGEPVDLVVGNTVLHWTEGDTYYQRYDCLKTYPYTMEDRNSVVEILSFMCETYVNLDGRYDRNRGQENNLTATPENFNQINDVYNQENNFFNYRSINPEDMTINSYPNMITWTNTKTNGEEVDSWTNITLASTLDFDGNLGKVNAIKRLNNQLYVFQDKGISLVLYNERTPISPMEGVPIEIANSGKVEGKTYISNMIGCQNKWSICEASTGLYFVDNITKGIWNINDKLNNLSDKLGFHSWINKTLNNVDIWNPVDFDSIVTYYDKKNGDVFFITKDECLAYSEPISIFSSFYSYENTPYIVNIADKTIAINTEKGDEDGEYKLWLQNEGVYNRFFNKVEPFYTTIVANPDIAKDKIFDVVEFRGDCFDRNDEYKSDYQPFTHLTVWNEYQKGSSVLQQSINTPSTLKRKFRVWRTPIPRAENGRDRMRNPWLYLKLTNSNLSNDNNNTRTVIHDIVVHYFE